MRVLSVEATGVSLYFVSINLKGKVLIYVEVEGVSMVASEGPSKFVLSRPPLDYWQVVLGSMQSGLRVPYLCICCLVVGVLVLVYYVFFE